MHIVDAAAAIMKADQAGDWVYWAVRSEIVPADPQPSDAEAIPFELVKVYTHGPSGYTRTGLLFWDESDDMAENLACCINEECGHDPDAVVEIVGANMARDDQGRVIN